MKLASVPASLALALFCGSVPAQGVVVVDASSGPGTDFTTIQAAVDAAADGDVILVRPGAYPETVVVTARSLVLHGDPGSGTVPTIDGIRVTDLAAAQTVEVRLLALQNSPSPPTEAIEVRDCAGSVWLEEITIPDLFYVPGHSLLVESCASVVLSRCSFGELVQVFAPGPPAVELLASNVHVFDSSFDPPLIGDVEGPPGIRAVGPGELGIYESTVHGTDGPTASFGAGACISYDGGDGVLLVGDVALFVQDSDIQGGDSDPTCFVSGDPGQPIVAGTGPVTMLGSLARTHRVGSPVRDDEAVHVELEGQPFDVVRVYFSIRPSPPLHVGLVDVPVFLGGPLLKVSVGSLGAPGALTVDVPVGSLGPGVSAIVLYAQALFVGTTTPGLVLSEPTAITVLDDAF